METVLNDKKPKTKSKVTTVPLRVKHETRKRIFSELAKANKKDFGRRIKPDDLIAIAIDLIESEHIKKLQEGSLTNSDRLERDYKAYVAKNGAISKDEYLGKLLDGKTANPLPSSLT